MGGRGLSLAAWLSVTVLAGVVAPTSGGATGGPGSEAHPGRPGLTHLARITSSDAPVVAIATWDGRTPTAGQRRGLAGTVERVQFFRHLPLAVVVARPAQLERAAAAGVIADAYPDERLGYSSAESTQAIRADRVRADGVTGKGTGVAIVDSGVDATHPDLADHVVRNVKIVGPEYGAPVTGHGGPPGDLVVPVESSPYPNSDANGHGTHVAGIVAADATTGPDQVGVAPDAGLLAYSTGELAIITVLAAFDDILAVRDEFDVRVVNNSWGSLFEFFDPFHPINAATKVLHDAGIVVVFAAGNAGEEMTLNRFATAPWVVSVGAATNGRERASLSSGGLEFDNSAPRAPSRSGHQRFDGDSVGLYHPDVSAPGVAVRSSATPTGWLVSAACGCPSTPGGSAAVSGTSMAAPHVAGVAALLFEARPELTPDEVAAVLEVTAAPMADAAGLGPAGHGFVDATAAVELVRRADFGPDLLNRLRVAADERALASSPGRVLATDQWAFSGSPVSAGPYVDARDFSVFIAPGTTAVKGVVHFPSDAEQLGANLVTEYELTLRDRAGEVIGRSTVSGSAGVASFQVALERPVTVEESWLLEVRGLLAAPGVDIDADATGAIVSVALAQIAG